MPGEMQKYLEVQAASSRSLGAIRHVINIDTIDVLEEASNDTCYVIHSGNIIRVEKTYQQMKEILWLREEALRGE